MEEKRDRLPLKSLDEAENELRYNMPPWAEADLKQKCLLASIKFVIYLPVVLVMTITSTLYILYLHCYIKALIPSNLKSFDDIWQFDPIRGLIFLFLMTIFVSNFIFSYIQTVITDPGSVPKTEDWELGLENQKNTEKTLQRKKDGSERVCKKCEVRKPDRCHHCKQCDRCVLKMDHHCAWVVNCIGYKNYKYFFLAVFYSALALILFICTFWEVVVKVLVTEEESKGYVLFIVSCFMLANFFAILLCGFLGFQLWLVWNGGTALEYCERDKGAKGKRLYSGTVMENFKEAFGNNWKLWLVPFGFYKAEDSGLYFVPRLS